MDEIVKAFFASIFSYTDRRQLYNLVILIGIKARGLGVEKYDSNTSFSFLLVE